VQAGDVVRAFTLEKRGGGTFHFPEEVKGRVVLLNFWASWCPECKIELPELAAITNRFKDKPFALLAVNMDRRHKAAERFLKKNGLKLQVLYDTDQKLVGYFSPVGVPATYLIGRDGKVVRVYLGFKKEYIDRYISDIAAQLEAMSREGSSSPGGENPGGGENRGEGPQAGDEQGEANKGE
jgi:peroxiredoxin